MRRAVGCRVHRRFAAFEVAVDILDDDDCVVDENPDRQGQREHRHVVEREVHPLHESEARDDAGRNRHGADERCAEIAEEQEKMTTARKAPNMRSNCTSWIDRSMYVELSIGTAAWPRPFHAADLRKRLADGVIPRRCSSRSASDDERNGDRRSRTTRTELPPSHRPLRRRHGCGRSARHRRDDQVPNLGCGLDLAFGLDGELAHRNQYPAGSSRFGCELRSRRLRR